MARFVLTRRQVLRGAGGFVIGLPLLPSLVKAPAYAQPTLGKRKYFVALASNHGGVYEATMYPSGGLDKTLNLYAGHTIRHGNLVAPVSNGMAVLSGVLQAPASALTPRLISKINVLRGLDVPWYIAHNTGGHLGNYARNDGNGPEGVAAQAFPTPTIDQLMAYSPSFYPTLDGLKSRTLNTGMIDQLSFNFSNPADRSGSIQPIVRQASPSVLFNKIFVPDAGSPNPMARKPIVDRVLENYRRLRNGNRRISVEDRQRLDAHIQRLDDLQKFTGGGGGASAACGGRADPGNLMGRARYRALIDVIVTAFLCGSSRIAVMGVQESEFASAPDDWHQGVAHMWNSTGQPKLVEANRNVFEQVFVDLISKLDVEEAPGQTILDNALVQWTNESGEETHDARSRPTITAGSAGGYFKTGLYVDYRKADSGKATGLTHAQYLATVLQAMGLQPAEWQNIPNNAPAGYGYGYVAGSYKSSQVAGVMSGASAPLSIITA